MVRTVPIQFPFEGQSSAVAYARQPPLTSESMLNVRPLDSKTERNRGAQRAGTEKHVSTQVSGSNPIVDMGVVVADNSQIAYAQLTASAVVDDGTDGSWSVDRDETGYSAVTDAAGNFYSITGAASWVKYNPQGWKLAEKAVPVLNSSGLVRALAVDSEESVYVVVSTGGTQSDARLYKYQLRFDGSYEQAYSGSLATEKGTAPGTVAFGSCLFIKDDTLYVALWDSTNTEAEIQRYDAVNELATLPGTADLAFSCNDVALGVCVDASDNIIVSHHASAFTTGAAQGLTKYNSLGVQQWAVTNTTATSGWDGANGGLGHACAVDSDGGIFCIGEGTTSGTTEWLNHVDADGTFDWQKTNGFLQVTDPWGRKLVVDSTDQVYAPLTITNSAHGIYVYEQDGTGVSIHSSNNLGSPRAVAIPPGGPKTGLTTEFVFYSADHPASATLARARIVSATLSSGSQRTAELVAVSNGTIATTTGSSWTTPTGGASALDATGEFVSGVTLFGKRYFLDGSSYKVYDLATATVSEFVATAAGGIPQKCKVHGAWRGRYVLARPDDNPARWFMSKIGDPGNFNFNVIPPVPPDSAVDGINSDVGAVPDIINCFIPFSDDLGFFGGDQSLWRLTGDPLDGGQIDDVSRTIGVAFGNRSWARDAGGRIYFMSTEGDVYQLTPPGELRNISQASINRSISQVDLSSKYAVLTWSERERGLYLHVASRSTFGTAAEHYFWSSETGGWFPVKYQNANHNPRSAVTLDGDTPGDRVVLLGCEDGYVRKYDEDAASDDGQAIESYVFLGPYGLPESGRRLRLYKWQVTLSGSDQGVSYALYASNRADDKGLPVYQGTLWPGKNDLQFSRAMGEFFWIKLASNAVNARWAFETGWMNFASAGRQRR